MFAPATRAIHVFRGTDTRSRSSACAISMLSPCTVAVARSASVGATLKYTSLCEPCECAITSTYDPAPVRLMTYSVLPVRDTWAAVSTVLSAAICLSYLILVKRFVSSLHYLRPKHNCLFRLVLVLALPNSM